MNKLISTNERIFISLVGPSGSGKSQLIYEWLTADTFQPAFDKIFYFYQHYQPLYGLMTKNVKNIEFIQGVNFEMIEALPNNGTNYLLIFDDSCEEISNSKQFVKIATAGRHRGLNTIYIKHNLFHKSKLGRDVELQNTHIVLFKSPRDVMQVGTLSQQLGLGSQLVEWYRDATSKAYGHLLIDLSPKTDDKLRFCTDSGKNPSKFYLPKALQRINFLDDEQTKSLYSPSIPVIFSQVQESFSSLLSKRVYPVSKRVYSKHAARGAKRFKKERHSKVQKRSTNTVTKKNKFT
jgi:hypothetical protein